MTEEEVRQEALRMALETAHEGESVFAIIDRANVYHAYMRGTLKVEVASAN